MWIITKNGRLAAYFKTQEEAERHRRAMERVSISLGMAKDRWRIKEVEESKVYELLK